MAAAGSIVLQDIPPFVTAAGYPAKPAGTNNEGLRRRGFSQRADPRGAARVQGPLPRGALARGREAAGSRKWRATSRRSHRWSRSSQRPAAASSADRMPPMRDATAAPGAVTIGIVAGEASGDALGAALIRALRERLPRRALRRHRRPADGSARAHRAGIRWRRSRSAGWSRCWRDCPGCSSLRRALVPALRSPSGSTCSSASTRRTSTSGSSGSSSAPACAPSTSSALRCGRGAASGCARSAAASTACWRCFRSSRRSTRRPACR